MPTQKKPRATLISLGSNMGNRVVFLRRAALRLSQSGIRLLRSSKIYETSPLGPRQRKFLNAAVKVETFLDPKELLVEMKKIERELGRRKTQKWGPRTIDLDLLFYGNMRLKSRSLTLPHPRYRERKFVLKPLCDLDASFVPPGAKLPVSQILSRLTDPGQKVKLHTRRGLL